MVSRHPDGSDGHRDSRDEGVRHCERDDVDVVWSVETQGAEIARDDDEVDGEAQADEKYDRD